MKRDGTSKDLNNKSGKKPPAGSTVKNGKQTSSNQDKDELPVNISKDIGEAYHASDVIINDQDPNMISEFPNSVMDVTKNENKLDLAEILDDRWNLFSKYFNKIDNIKNLLLNKNFGKLSMSQLINDLQIEILESENKLKQLKEVINN